MASGHHDFPNIAPEVVTPGQLLMILQSMHAQQAVQIANVTSLRQELQQVRAEQAELVEAWTSAKNVVRFVKMLAAVGAAVAFLAAWFKGQTPG
jgi:hypothetical protein